MRANPELMSMIGYAGLATFTVVFAAWGAIAARHVFKDFPMLTRVLIFIALVTAAMLIIIGVASVSHAAGCEPPAKLLFIWDAAPDPCVVHHKHHRHHRVMGATKPRAQVSGSSVRDSSAVGVALRPLEKRVRTPPAAPTSFHWKNSEHAKLFEEFQDWLYLGKR